MSLSFNAILSEATVAVLVVKGVDISWKELATRRDEARGG